MSKSDPTKDPEFQKVVRHFVTTPHKPHSEMKVGKRKKRVMAPSAIAKIQKPAKQKREPKL
jgi:hypothetical protein